MYAEVNSETNCHSFEYRYTVCLEDTNLLGNVYFVNHLRWQGHCRELFLKQHVPEILEEFDSGLRLVTTQCSCQYHRELMPFDEVLIRMTLNAPLSGNRIGLGFKYYRKGSTVEELVAEGSQEIVCLRAGPDRLVPDRIPAGLRAALERYSEPTRVNV